MDLTKINEQLSSLRKALSEKDWDSKQIKMGGDGKVVKKNGPNSFDVKILEPKSGPSTWNLPKDQIVNKGDIIKNLALDRGQRVQPNVGDIVSVRTGSRGLEIGRNWTALGGHPTLENTDSIKEEFARLDRMGLIKYESALEVSLKSLKKAMDLLRKDDSYTSEIDRLLNNVRKDAESIAHQMGILLKDFASKRGQWKEGTSIQGEAAEKNRVIIVDFRKKGNSFGDIDLEVDVELRDPKNKTIKKETFKADESEGSHSIAYKQLELAVKDWAKKNNAVFTGKIG